MKKREKYVEGKDYYIENGRVIFTKEYLLKRKKCCNGKCENCPYTITNE
jgi:hypothetical protein